MTNPGRILEQVALLAAMIAFLTESRAQLGAFVHRFFLAAAPAASVLLFTVSVPNLIYYKKLVSETSGSPVRTALCFAFALFFLARLLSYAKSSSADTTFKSGTESIEVACKGNQSTDSDTDNI